MSNRDDIRDVFCALLCVLLSFVGMGAVLVALMWVCRQVSE